MVRLCERHKYTVCQNAKFLNVTEVVLSLYYRYHLNG